MRRIWEIFVAISLLLIMVGNAFTGRSLLGGDVVGACLVFITITLTWWFRAVDVPIAKEKPSAGRQVVEYNRPPTRD